MPWLLLGLLLMALVFGPQWWARYVLTRYRQPGDRYARTGGDLARALLDRAGLPHVPVEITEGGDHYDPMAKRVRLSADHLRGHSLTALTVAAHEVGHAIQDHQGYRPLAMRTRLVRMAQITDRIASLAILIAPAAAMLGPRMAMMMFAAGLLGMLVTAVVHVVTLPVEWDASFGRALPMLTQGGDIAPRDLPAARRILRACALTYLAASLASMFNVWRWLAVLRRQ